MSYVIVKFPEPREVFIDDQPQAISGQVVQKPHAGRPQGGLSEAARRLPVAGATEQARRKSVERAIRINSISAEAKAAATSTGLGNNQSALLSVAREPTAQGQLDKIRELANRQTTQRMKRADTDTGTTAMPPGTDGAKQQLAVARSAELEASISLLKAAWCRSSEFVVAWTRAPWRVRERFISEVLRMPESASQAQSKEAHPVGPRLKPASPLDPTRAI